MKIKSFIGARMNVVMTQIWIVALVRSVVEQLEIEHKYDCKDKIVTVRILNSANSSNELLDYVLNQAKELG